MRECLQDIYADSANRTEAEAKFKALRSWMMRSRPEPMKALARQLRRHYDLPDLRQTRPQHRHRLTRFTHTKQRKA